MVVGTGISETLWQYFLRENYTVGATRLALLHRCLGPPVNNKIWFAIRLLSFASKQAQSIKINSPYNKVKFIIRKRNSLNFSNGSEKFKSTKIYGIEIRHRQQRSVIKNEVLYVKYRPCHLNHSQSLSAKAEQNMIRGGI